MAGIDFIGILGWTGYFSKVVACGGQVKRKNSSFLKKT
jgi:hypothetical protein